MQNLEFDLAVVGGGPGGYVAAIRAAQLGMQVALIEREHLGGVCLNWGCIPTKALLRTAEVKHLIENAEQFGLSVGKVGFDLEKIVERSRGIAKKLNEGIEFLLKKNKVEVFLGSGALLGDGRISFNGFNEEIKEISASHIILATGARARTLSGIKSDKKLIWTYKEAMVPEVLPETLLVVGSGAIGIEFASFYSDLGSNVTVIEVLDKILPVEDEEISDAARKAFEEQGITIHTGATLASLDPGDNSVAARIKIGERTQELTFDRAILAVGITGNVEDIGLENTNVEVESGHVATNEWMETREAGVYAIGDLTGPPWLAHKASHEAMICVEKIAGENPNPLDASRIPGCTYCRPQIASIGLTELAAKEAGYEVRVGRFPFSGNGKAIALGEANGLVKTIFDSVTGEILGAHMIGAEVTELIHAFGMAKTLETTELEMMQTIFPHPTLSEMFHESVLDAYDRVIHV